ncbi:MAG: YhcH/YjgK/YiaL family protein [Rikenellaceae bacterium]
MIVTSLSKAVQYISLHERFRAAFDSLLQVDLFSLESGTYPIDGEDIYMIVAEDLDLKKVEDAKLEVHDKYIDIQLPISAEEGFLWADRSDCQMPCADMDKVKDIQFFDDEPSSFIKIHPGQLVIFFPWDAHGPLVGEGKIKKCVIKVLV